MNQKIKDLLSDYIEKMSNKDEKLFLEGIRKRIEIRKMFWVDFFNSIFLKVVREREDKLNVYPLFYT